MLLNITADDLARALGKALADEGASIIASDAPDALRPLATHVGAFVGGSYSSPTQSGLFISANASRSTAEVVGERMLAELRSQAVVRGDPAYR